MPETINKIKNEGKQDAHQYAGCNGDIQPEIFSFNYYVTRESPKPRKPSCIMKDQTGYKEHSANQHQYLAYSHTRYR